MYSAYDAHEVEKGVLNLDLLSNQLSGEILSKNLLHKRVAD